MRGPRTLVKAFLLASGCWLLIPGAVAMSFERLVMPGPVSQAHAEFEDNCSACHSPIAEKAQGELCATCHEQAAADLKGGEGFHGRHPDVQADNCQSCHREHRGRDAENLSFVVDVPAHVHTDFPLLGMHQSVTCQGCHTEGKAAFEAPQQCVACHAEQDVHKGSLGTACESCHDASGWSGRGFDHATTGFPLTGSHAATSCESCHGNRTLAETPTRCAGCHARDDAHGGRLGKDCEQCHGTDRWQTSSFKHFAVTSFDLLGGHATLSCESCHTTAPMEPLNEACVSCHSDDDVHKGSFGQTCDSCHTVYSWGDRGFDHAKETRFPLLGAHKALNCKQCHEGSLDEPLDTACATCHEDPHAGQLATACTLCHGMDGWRMGVRFDHALSPFPLLGQHIELPCVVCHETSRFHDAPQDCAGCHAADDVHEGTQGTACGQCHNPNHWRTTHFDHTAAAAFPLLGAHKNLRCESCHTTTAALTGISAEQCVSCHRNDDPHQGRFGSNCAQCHNSERFSEVTGL